MADLSRSERRGNSQKNTFPSTDFRRKVMSVYESLEIKFDPRNILFRNLDKILPA